ncbi:MAG: glycerol-3-phosphate dehydrogenase [Hyphomicrobium sp.]|nr:glycerol-3-phosphate dehydrogenase [Hyphomicrobium sp.]
MEGPVFDVLVIGGGINGAGVAADAAGRGLSVCLVEMGDLASGTSQASSKLIHGGLRYLEHYEFRLVREALAEREVMLTRAPHIVWPLRFVMPQTPGTRSRLKLRAGLFLYDHLAKRRRIPRSRAINLADDPAGEVLRPDVRHAFSYWDCWVDDSRLVVLNARLAADRGALIRTRTRVTALERGVDTWTATLDINGGRETCRARVIVNAAGPWADTIGALTRDNAPNAATKLRLVKGSHIVVPRIDGADDAFLFQNTDGRVVFVLPFEDAFTLIGTTDVPATGSLSDATCSPEEQNYLLTAANCFLASPLVATDVIWRFAGVRPLQADETETNPSALSRDYHLELSGHRHGDALLTIVGGKITTYRCLAEAVLRRLEHLFPGLAPGWTAIASLPGGDIPNADFGVYLESLARLYAWLPEPVLHGLARRHGSLTRDVIGDARRLEDMGAIFAGRLTEREVRYLAEKEWAMTPEDVLWRRTKVGLHLKASHEHGAASAAIAALLVR